MTTHKNYILLGLCVAFFIFTVLIGSQSLTSIEVRFSGNQKEHRDKYIPMMNPEEMAPDYMLQVKLNESWKTVGSYSNQSIGTSVMKFTINEAIPTRLIGGIRLLDDDLMEDDVLEVVEFSEGTIKGKNYSFNVIFGYTLFAGLTFFWMTYVGKAILVGISIVVVMIFLSALSL